MQLLSQEGKTRNVNSQKQKLESQGLHKKREMNCRTEIGGRRARPGHIHCQMHKLWESQKRGTPVCKEFNTTAEFFFQAEIKLLDSSIRQTLHLPGCNTSKRMTGLNFSALEMSTFYKGGAEKEATIVLFLRADMTDR